MKKLEGGEVREHFQNLLLNKEPWADYQNQIVQQRHEYSEAFGERTWGKTLGMSNILNLTDVSSGFRQGLPDKAFANGFSDKAFKCVTRVQIGRCR